MARATIRLDLDQAVITRIGADEAHRRVTEATRATFVRANILTPVRSGRLRAGNSLRVRQLGPVSIGEVFNQVRYAAAVHNGARPRIIRPRRPGGVLRFTMGGKVVYAKSARWPGMRAQPWLSMALVQTAPRYGFVVLA